MKNGVSVNIDGDFLYYIYKSCDMDVSDIRSKLESYVNGYKNKGISDILLNCFFQTSLFPSQVFTWRGEKLHRKMENGQAVDYTESKPVRAVADIYEAFGGDVVGFLLDEFRKSGMNTWLSVRMNDAHNNHMDTNWAYSDFRYEAKKKGMMLGDAAPWYFEECFDYSYQEVRDKMFAYICECVDKYDVDGIELDFMREMYCFDYRSNPECHKIMTELIARIKEYLLKKGDERGKKIRLAVCLCRDIEDSKILGFDAKEWIDRSLVDVIIPRSRWSATDSGLPMDKWCELARNSETEIWGGIDILLDEPLRHSLETVKGAAVQHIDDGADKIYLYNYFRVCIFEPNHDKMTNTFGQDFGQEDKYLTEVWNACADEAKMRSGVRRHLITRREWYPTPTIEGQYDPLPVQTHGPKLIRIKTGRCQGSKLTLFVGVRKGYSAPICHVDGKKAQLLGLSDDAYCLHPRSVSWETDRSNTEFYAYSFEASDNTHRDVWLTGNDVWIDYLEIKVES